jgi:hypothetical protein
VATRISRSITFFVIGESVGVEFFADCGVFGFHFFVLIENPFERGAVAEFVFPCGVGDVVEGGFSTECNATGFLIGFQDRFGCVGLACADPGVTDPRVSPLAYFALPCALYIST